MTDSSSSSLMVRSSPTNDQPSPDNDKGKVKANDVSILPSSPPALGGGDTDKAKPEKPKRKGHKWTDFEMQAVCALICKGHHLAYLPGSRRIRKSPKDIAIDFATALNNALNGKSRNYDQDIPLRDVRELLVKLEKEHKYGVRFIERQDGPQVITRKKLSVLQRPLGFDGSIAEWTIGNRRERVMEQRKQRIADIERLRREGDDSLSVFYDRRRDVVGRPHSTEKVVVTAEGRVIERYIPDARRHLDRYVPDDDDHQKAQIYSPTTLTPPQHRGHRGGDAGDTGDLPHHDTESPATATGFSPMQTDNSNSSDKRRLQQSPAPYDDSLLSPQYNDPTPGKKRTLDRTFQNAGSGRHGVRADNSDPFYDRQEPLAPYSGNAVPPHRELPPRPDSMPTSAELYNSSTRYAAQGSVHGRNHHSAQYQYPPPPSPGPGVRMPDTNMSAYYDSGQQRYSQYDYQSNIHPHGSPQVPAQAASTLPPCPPRRAYQQRLPATPNHRDYHPALVHYGPMQQQPGYENYYPPPPSPAFAGGSVPGPGTSGYRPFGQGGAVYTHPRAPGNVFNAAITGSGHRREEYTLPPLRIPRRGTGHPSNQYGGY